MAELNVDILPPAQRVIWSQLDDVPGNFVLYGGTAVALQLGHRVSEDFDFFTGLSFNPDALKACLVRFPDAETIENKKDTLTLSIPAGAEVVKISFFGGLPLNRVQEPLQAGNGIYVASLPDLLGTKCKVVIDRAHIKDYLDIVAVLKDTGLTLADGIAAAMAIYGESFVPIASLKALSYTADLPATLPDADLAVIHKAVTEVALARLPVVEPLGAIGDYTAPADVPACRPS